MRKFEELAAIAGGAIDAIRMGSPDLEAIVIVVERLPDGAVCWAGETSLKPPSTAALLMREVRLAWGGDE